MEFDTATITGIVILGVIFILIIFWVLSRKKEEEYPERKRWQYE
jgi:LPXTG-motif cell wall-anchored protein